MPRTRPRRPIRPLVLLALAGSLSLFGSLALEQPVRASDESVVTDVVAALKAAGMDCTSTLGLTTCDIGADCTFGPNGEDDCAPAGLPWGTGLVRTPEHPSGTVRQVRVMVEYTTATASSARALFGPIVDAGCPGTSAAVAGWITDDPKGVGDFKGDGCVSGLYFGRSVDGSEKWYTLHILLDPSTQATATPAPVAASGDLAADAVALMQRAGMECISEGDDTLCDIGADCTARACAIPAGASATTGRVSRDRSVFSTPLDGILLMHGHNAPAPDTTGIRALFEDMIQLVCPGAADAAAGWFSAPTTLTRYPGAECAAILMSDSGPDATGGTRQRYDLDFESEEPRAGASDPALATAGPSPTATAAAVIANPTPLPPGTGSNGAVLPPGGFVASIPTPSQMTTDPAIVIQTALLALLILFLMPFPAQLFNSTVEEHRDEIRGWLAPLSRGLRSAGRGIGAFWRSPLGIASLLVVSALLYALLDPTFSFSVDGLITIVGILAGLVIVTALFSVPAVVWHRRRGDRPVIEAIPFTLVIAIACVGISRLADFQPGYLYGLVIGLGFARTLDPTGQGRSGAAAAALMLASALLAWLGLGLMVDVGIGGFVGVVIATILAAVMVAGLEGVAFGLMPIRFLPGEPIFAWNRLAWGVLIFIGLFAFMHILINPQSGYLGDSSRTPLFTMLALLIGFGVASVAFWGYFRFRPERATA